MDRRDAVAWVLSVTNSLRLSQSKTLAALVSSALVVGRISLANLGRRLSASTSVKHRIKRVWRFTSNRRVEVGTAMEGVVAQLLRRLSRRRKNGCSRPLMINLDWTDIRGFKTLMAAADIRGRSIPLLWASYPKWRFFKSQNNLEEGLLRRLKTMLPEGTRVILLADRGFGRTELARLCQQLGFSYLIRIHPGVEVRSPRYTGNLLDYPVKKGIAHLLRDVQYRQQDPVRQNVVIHWKKGLPKKRDECWFLMTDLDHPAAKLSELYGQRMTIEELFRDGKNRRNGWSLRDIQLKTADRIDRLLLILALTYILLCGLGCAARRCCDPSTWCSNTRHDTCSVFTIGRLLVHESCVSIHDAIKALIHALANAPPNWG